MRPVSHKTNRQATGDRPMTTYKKVPNSNIEVPVWMDATALAKPISNALRQRNAEIVRRLKAKFFGGAR